MIISFPRHRLYGRDIPCNCNRDAGRWSCVVCAGGLALCAVCHGAEGSLPTDCPGYEMPDGVEEAVYAGEVDYDVRLGWIERDSTIYQIALKNRGVRHAR